MTVRLGGPYCAGCGLKLLHGESVGTTNPMSVLLHNIVLLLNALDAEDDIGFVRLLDQDTPERRGIMAAALRDVANRVEAHR